MNIRWSVPVVLLALAGLTACGTDLDPDVHPGAAAVVGGTTISLDEVDELAEDLCSVDRPINESSGRSVPLGIYRSLAVDNLTGYELAQQYAEERGLEPAPEFAGRLDQMARQLRQAGAPTYAVEIRVGYQERVQYLEAILSATGDLEGAQQDFAAWADDVEISVDPRFGSVDMGEYSAPEGLSERITEVDPAEAGQLPTDQRCG